MTSDQTGTPHHRFGPTLREAAKVRFLELFFDLVFVLAFTQCTALMVAREDWTGIIQGLFVLAILWWSWAAYAWLTSVLDPEEGAVRIVMFGAMGALTVVALAVPEAFGDHGLHFALAYGLVRFAHVGLFALAGRNDPGLLRSVLTISVSSSAAIGLLTGAAFLEGVAQGALWAVAIVIDFGLPAVFGVAGWRLVPAHFAERHGLIIILALGESIVVIGVGATVGLTAGVIVAAVLGVALAAALWWTYFDVVALITEHRLTRIPPGRERNVMARNSYSYLHYPMVAGIVVAAVGLENALHHVDEPLHTVPAAALLGGVALYLLAHVALRLHNAGSLNYHRLGLAALLVALVPVAVRIPAIATLAGVAALLWVLVAIEVRYHGQVRTQLRRGAYEG